MYNQKTLQIIELVKNMPNKEADILEIFIAGLRAGKQFVKTEFGIEQTCNLPKCQNNQLRR